MRSAAAPRQLECCRARPPDRADDRPDPPLLRARRRSSASSSRTSPAARRGASPRSPTRTSELTALCHLGSNLVPSGAGCGAFADLAAKSGARMLIGEEGAVSDLWDAARKKLPRPRARPSRAARLRDHRSAAGGRHRPAAGDGGRPRSARSLVRRRALRGARRRSAATRPDGFRWRTRTQIEEGRSWLWAEDGVIRFKAEASAWTPAGGAAAAGLDRPTGPPAGLRGAGAARPDPAAARANADRLPLRAGRERAAIRLYESVGMHHVLDYRSVLL